MIQEKRSFPIGTSIISAIALVTLPVIIIRYIYGLGAG